MNVSSLEDLQEMQIGARVIVRPRRLATERPLAQIDRGAVAHARERKAAVVFHRRLARIPPVALGSRRRDELHLR